MKNIVESFPSTQDLIKSKSVLFKEMLNSVKQEGLVIFNSEDRFDIEPKENAKLNQILSSLNIEKKSISIPNIDKLKTKIKDEDININLKSEKQLKR